MSPLSRNALAVASYIFVSNVASAVDYAALPREEAVAAVARGATVVHDYGAFAWVAGSGRGVEAARAYALDLGGRVFDPTLDTAARASAYAGGKALRLVQFDGPIRQAWLDALARDGVTVVQYIPPFSYVVWADAAALSTAKSRSNALRYTGDFLPDYKTANVDAGLARGEREWRVMLYRGARLDAAALRATGAVVGKPVTIDPMFDIVDVQADAAAIESLARLPGVYAIEPVPRDGGLRAELAGQITANNLGANSLPVPGYLAWLANLGVNGDGVTVADVDGGVAETHPDLVNRMLPCVGGTCGGDAADPHGTHTAGIIAGDGSSGTRDAGGFLRGLGTAPGARLIEQIYNPTFVQAGGMLKLMRESYDNGGHLSSNSWGPSPTPRGYDLDTRQVDVGVRDTKPDIAGDQPLAYVLSIMNGSGGISSQGTPDEAKNTITVGSTKAQQQDLAANPAFNDLSGNSGAGPALDGRRIPHVVAPGCLVDSIVSAVGYGLKCGTSMATPQVAGAAALFIQKYRNTHAGASPSAALVKAAIVAAAQDLAGNVDADGNALGHRPDSKQGWGRLRTDWLLGARATLYFDKNTRTFDNTGEEWATSVAPADPTLPMQVVLVWTDAPGHGLGGTTPAWNNDLDLLALTGATSYKGNVFGADGWSAAGGSADGRNNIESVVLPAGAGGGEVSLRVTAANVASDALPNAGDATDQDFALVCVNCTARPDYALTVRNAERSICTATTASTSYDIGVDSALGYTDAVTLSLTGLPAGAAGSVLPAVVMPPGGTVATLTQLGAAAAGTHAFQLHSVSTSATRDREISLTLAHGVPAAPVLATPANNAIDVAQLPTFVWNAPAQGRDYVLEVATDPAFENLAFTRTVAQTSTTPTAKLDSSTRHYWRVRSSNVCGMGGDSAVGSFRTVAAPGDCATGTTPAVVFDDTAENGTNGWTATAAVGNFNWSISTARPFHGTHAWLAQDPARASDQRLTSPVIALPAGRSPLTLRFMSDQSIEGKSDGSGCWDGGFLEISTDGGATFSAIPPAAMLTDPYDGPLDRDNPAAGTPAWCGDPQTWVRSVVNLDAWAGQSVQLRFRLTSDGAVGRIPDGWVIDDIGVQGCVAASPDAIFADDFD